MALATRMEEVARALVGESRQTEEWLLGHVGETLAMLTIALRNAAHSGPQSQFEQLRRLFPDEYANGDWPDAEPLITHRARLDMVAFLTVGDMVLSDVAALVLARTMTADGEPSWRNYMRLLDGMADDDPPSPQVRPARVLDVTLREARHRLVAHRLVTQGSLSTHDLRDNTLTPIVVDPGGLEGAYPYLVSANERLNVPFRAAATYSHSAWSQLVDWLVNFAGDLDQEGRDLMRNAFRRGAYELPPMSTMGEAILVLVGAAREFPRGEVA